MTLQRLLGDTPASAFLESHYLKLPYARPGGCAGLAALGSWEVVERVLTQPGVDVLVGRGGTQRPGTPSPEEARRLVAEGWTVGIRQAHRHDAGLAELVAGFACELRAVADVHLYCTPANQPGFGWHYDPEEVFVLQTQGAKEWHLRKNTVHPWPLMEAIPTDQRFEREIMPVMRCELHAGDWLYVPGGWWHRTQARDVESISLSVGLVASTALDVLDALRPQLRESLQWRQRIPPADSDEAVRRCREVFAELGRDLAQRLASEEFVREFLKRNS